MAQPMTTKLPPNFNYYNATSFSSAGHLHSSITLVGKIFSPDLLELSCDALIDLKSHKQVTFDALSKSCIMDNIIDLVWGLCTPAIPLSVSELMMRVGHALPVKLRPGDRTLEDFRLIATERGGLKKRATPCMLPYDKIIVNLRAIDSRMDATAACIFVQIVEYLLSFLVHATLNYHSKIDTEPSSTICVTDVQVRFSLFQFVAALIFPGSISMPL